MTDYLLLRLRARHAALEQEIDHELAAPLPDAVRITEMKKEKLRVRDRIHGLLRSESGVEARV